MSSIRERSLAPQGKEKMDWVREHMPVLKGLEESFRKSTPFRGLRIAVCLHLEAKTAYMCRVLKEAGAGVVVTGSNPLSTQDDVASALVEEGLEVHAWYNATREEYREHLEKAANFSPELLIDDGGDLVSFIHTKYREQLPRIIGGSEETTTGLIRLRAMEKEGVLGFPVMAVNDALCKHLFDNRYGTGQSTWDGIMRATNLIVAGKDVVVIGYGWCGKGVAMRARGLGARVIVCEVDPIKSLEAHMDGFEVMPLQKAASAGDFFVTVTGCSKVLTREHFEAMKDQAVLSNAGHFDVEIDKEALVALSGGYRRVRKDVDAYALPDGRRLYLLGEGRLVNLAAADGHPAEIMDMSFALQVLALKYLLDNRGELANRVLPVPQDLDSEVAKLKLKAMNIEIDRLTDEQKAYLDSWEID